MPVNDFHRLEAAKSLDAPLELESISKMNKILQLSPSQSSNKYPLSPPHPKHPPLQLSPVPSASNSTGPEKGKLLTRISDGRQEDGPNLSHAPTQPALSAHNTMSEAGPFQSFNRTLIAPEGRTLLTRISDGRHPDGKGPPVTHPRRADEPKPPDAPKSYGNVSQASRSLNERVSSPNPPVYHRHSPPEPQGRKSSAPEMGPLLTRLSDDRRPDGEAPSVTYPRRADEPKPPDAPKSQASRSLNERVSSSNTPVYHRHAPSEPPGRKSSAPDKGTLLTRLSDDRRPEGEAPPATHPRRVDEPQPPDGPKSYRNGSQASRSFRERVSSPAPPVYHRPHSPSERKSPAPLVTRISDDRRQDRESLPVSHPRRADEPRPYSNTSQASRSFRERVSSPAPHRPYTSSQPSPARKSPAPEMGTLRTRLSEDRRPDGEVLHTRRADQPNVSDGRRSDITGQTVPVTHPRRVDEPKPPVPVTHPRRVDEPKPPVPVTHPRRVDESKPPVPVTHPRRADEPRPPDAPKSYSNSQASRSFKQESSPTLPVYHRPYSPSQPPARKSSAPEGGTLLTRISDDRRPDGEALPVPHTRGADQPNVLDGRRPNTPGQTVPVSHPRGADRPNVLDGRRPNTPRQTTVHTRGADPPHVLDGRRPNALGQTAPVSQPRGADSPHVSDGRRSNTPGQTVPVSQPRGADQPNVLNDRRPNALEQTLPVSHPREADKANHPDAPMQPKSVSSHSNASQASPSFDQGVPSPTPPVYRRHYSPSQPPERNSPAPEVGTLLTRMSDGCRPDGEALPVTHPRGVDKTNHPDAPMQPKSGSSHSHVSQESPSFNHGGVARPNPPGSHWPHPPSQPPARNSPAPEVGTPLTRVPDGRRLDGQMLPANNPLRAEDPNLPNVRSQPRSESIASEASPRSNQGGSNPTPSVDRPSHSVSLPPFRDSTTSGRATLLTRMSEDRRPDEKTLPVNSPHQADEPLDAKQPPHEKGSEAPPHSLTLGSNSSWPDSNNHSRPPSALPTADHDSTNSTASLSGIPRSPRRSGLPLKARISLGDDESLIVTSPIRSVFDNPFPSVPKRQADTEEESEEQVSHKRRKLDNGPIQSECSSRRDAPIKTASKIFTTPLDLGGFGRDAERAADLQRLQRQVSELEAELTRERKETKLIQNELEEERGGRARAELRATDLQRLQIQVSELERELTRERQEARLVQNELEEERGERARAERRAADLQMLQRQVSELERELTRERQEAKLIQNELEEERSKRARAELRVVDLQRLQRQVSDLEGELTRERKEVKLVQNELEEERGERARAERQAADLQRLQTQISELDRELTRERQEAKLIRNELEEERGKRARAELIVEGVRHEMKEPFIVPSLLDAFISVTDESNVCMDKSAL